jgi:hypothetical protein
MEEFTGAPVLLIIPLVVLPPVAGCLFLWVRKMNEGGGGRGRDDVESKGNDAK